uniref:Uncharacterized protein n=1 Tax=Sphaerodactylus townsendi TaxID=933632 RepID=A0ACB8ELT8_9SAUR
MEINKTDESFCEHDRNSEVEEPANMTAEEADEMVSKCDGGVEATLEYAKMWCKYVKELLNWVDKRLNYETEFAKNILKIAEMGRNAVKQQNYMPLQQLYTMVMEHDIKTGKVAIDTAGILQEREYYKNDSILRMDKSIHYLQRLARPGESQSARVQAEKCQRHCGGNKQLEKAASLSRKQLKHFYSSSINSCFIMSSSESKSTIEAASVLMPKLRQQELKKLGERIVSHIRNWCTKGDEVMTRGEGHLEDVQSPA